MEIEMKKAGVVIAVLSVVVLIATIVFTVPRKIEFEQRCSGHLKNAADASSVVLAEQELGKAIDFLEEKDLVEGSSHWVYSTPKTDISFWYTNLKSAHQELKDFPADADSLTISNHLMKLRETLLDSRDGGTRVTKPKSIADYPYQIPVNVGLIGSASGMLLGLGLAAGNCQGGSCSE